MARTFGGASSDRAVVAGAASHNQLTEFTFVVRVYPTALTDNNRLVCKCSASDTSARQQVRISGTGGDIIGLVTGNGANAQSQSNSTPLVNLNKWYTVALTYSDSGDKKSHLYVGAEDGALAEVTYASQVALDSLRGDETGSLVWGNGRPGTDNLAFQGREADGMVFASSLSLQDLMAIHRGFIDPRAVIFNPLWGESSTEPDLSKNTNTASVTGTTKVDGPPMSKWRQSRVRYSRISAVVSNPFENPSTSMVVPIPMRLGVMGFTAGVVARQSTSNALGSIVALGDSSPMKRMAIPGRIGPLGPVRGTSPRGATTSPVAPASGTPTGWWNEVVRKFHLPW